jgi:hypothetical protein
MMQLDRSIPVTKSKPFVFTPQHEEILLALLTYHLLTSQQITRLLRPKTPGNLTTIQTRLRQLTQEKYVLADPLPTKRGPRPNVYALALKGRRHVAAVGYTVTKHYESGELARLTYTKQHILELNDFLITAATLPSFEPSITMTDLQHDLDLQQQPLEWIDGQGKLRILKPDALLQFHHAQPDGRERHYLLWIELDRGHHSPDKFQKQLADRFEFFVRGYHTTLLHRRGLTVLFVTPQGEARVAAMRSLARKLFPAVSLTSAENQLFKFASVPPLMQPQPSPLTVFCEPYWLTAYGDPDKLQTLIRLTDED